MIHFQFSENKNVQQGVLVRYHSKEMTYYPIFKRFGKQKIILYESILFIFVHQTKTDRGGGLNKAVLNLCWICVKTYGSLDAGRL